MCIGTQICVCTFLDTTISMHVCPLLLSQMVLYPSHFWTWMKYPMQDMGSSFLSSYRGPGWGSLGVQRSLFPGTNLHQLGTGEETGGHQADKSPLSFSFPKTTPSVLSPYNPFREILLTSEHACWVTCYGSFQHVIQQELALQFIKSISLHLSLLLFLLPLPLQTWTSTSQRKH